MGTQTDPRECAECGHLHYLGPTEGYDDCPIDGCNCTGQDWASSLRALRERDAAWTAEARRLAVELLLLEVYNARRIAAGHDFGNGQRHSELNRRRRALVALDPGRDLLNAVASVHSPIFTPDELAAAWRKVGAPRYRRALRDRDLYGSPGVLRTAQTWETMRLLYGSAS